MMWKCHNRGWASSGENLILLHANNKSAAVQFDQCLCYSFSGKYYIFNLKVIILECPIWHINGFNLGFFSIFTESLRVKHLVES